MAEQAEAWEELQRAGATPENPAPPGLWRSLADRWRRATPRQKGVVVFAALSALVMAAAVVVGVGVAVGKMLHNHQARPVVAAAPTPTLTAMPTATPTPTPKPTPTPTPLPRLTVWSPMGNCAYVRPAPGADNDPQACVPNGTEVVDLGQRKQAGGFTWAKVQYPTKNGYASVGWMATQVVAWAIQPDKVTGNRKAPFYRENKAAVMLYLPPHTPLIVLQDNGDGWLWVQLPDGRKGFVKAKDLEK